MDAREVLARKILRDENTLAIQRLRMQGVDPYSDDPWAGDQDLRDAYLAAADEYIAALDRAGYTIVHKAVRTNHGVPQEVD